MSTEVCPEPPLNQPLQLIEGERFIDDWRHDAICRQNTGDEFYPEKGGSISAAKYVCSLCTVQDECLAFALDAGERYGVWGGLSERERRVAAKLAEENPLHAQRYIAEQRAQGYARAVNRYARLRLVKSEQA